MEAHGVIGHSGAARRRTDFLYRVSLKCFIRNDNGEVLVVKESGREWWDLPGGGMDHGEGLRAAIAREMNEEVSMEGEFAYRVIAVEEPAYLQHYNFWQIRLIFEVTPRIMVFSPGHDSDELAFISPETFEHAELSAERRIYEYSQVSGN